MLPGYTGRSRPQGLAAAGGAGDEGWGDVGAQEAPAHSSSDHVVPKDFVRRFRK